MLGTRGRLHSPVGWAIGAGTAVFAAAAAGWASISSIGWFQLASAGLASALAAGVAYREVRGEVARSPAPPLRPRPEGLPADIADFTGREEEVRRLADLLAGEQQHNPQAIIISALSGKGGVGKTRLAVHVAHLIRARFPDGQLYVNLRGAEAESLDPSAVLADFLVELGEPHAAIPDGVEARAARYRAVLTGRRTLVVLDNARDEAQVRPLLPGSQSCVVLITSRSRLAGLEGTTLMALDVMAEEDALRLLTWTAGAPRVVAEPEQARRIVALCGMLPLAVRVVGAQLAGRPEQSLRWSAGRLTDERTRLSRLRVGDIEVRSSLALSYPHQPAPTRQAFRLLGLLRSADIPAWELAALAEVPLVEAEALCERLIDAGLLDPPHEDAAGQLRYRMHDLLRLLALELAQAEESDHEGYVRRLLETEQDAVQHAAHLLDVEATPVDAAALDRLTLAGVAEALADDPARWLRIEAPTLVLGVEQAHQTGHWALACDLAAALTDFFDTDSRWEEWEASHLVAVAAARALRDPAREADLLWRLGRRYRHGKPEQALATYEAAIGVYRSLGDRRGEGRTLLEAGVVHREQGGLAEARRCYTDCLTIFTEVGDRRYLAYALRRLAFVETDQAEIASAIEHFEQCVPILEEFDDVRWLGRTLRGLAIAQRLLARHEDAERTARRALAAFQETGDRRGEGYALLDLGGVQAERGQHEEATESLRGSLRHFHTMSDDRGRAYAFLDLASLDGRCGRFAEAVTAAERALSLCGTVRDRRGAAWAELCLGDLAREQGNLPEALRRYVACVPAFAELDDHVGNAQVRLRRGIAETRLGDADAARVSWTEALTLFRAAGMPQADRLAQWLERPPPPDRMRDGIGRLHYPLG